MYHTIILVGNLGRDPEMRYTPSGQAVTNLSVASNRKWNNSQGEPQEETIWFRVSVWGKSAEACNTYLAKGKKVLVEGRLNPDDSGNPKVFARKDGSAGASFEVTANQVKFLSSKNEDIAEDSHMAGGGDIAAATDPEKIPF